MNQKMFVKPFIKWVGGKTQLLPQLSKIINNIQSNNDIDNYVEPFVGGGALFFWLKSQGKIKNATISDINQDLVLTYRVVQSYVDKLIVILEDFENRYMSLDVIDQEAMFYDIRSKYNQEKENFDYLNSLSEAAAIRAAQFIFMNKTCFNGLYRQNSLGKFNVPFGKYKTPKICDKQNLLNCSLLLNDTNILCGDFEITKKFVSIGTLVYLDPPYKPINKTSSFTKYHKGDFNDSDQIRLAKYYEELDLLSAKIILSNSDPRSVDTENSFFDDLYKQFDIMRVNVSRTISATASSRKTVTELIIRNAVVSI